MKEEIDELELNTNTPIIDAAAITAGIMDSSCCSVGSMNDMRINTDAPIMTIYNAENEEILRFENNGDIYLHNKLIENDLQVVEGFKEFLIQNGLYK